MASAAATATTTEGAQVTEDPQVAALKRLIARNEAIKKAERRERRRRERRLAHLNAEAFGSKNAASAAARAEQSSSNSNKNHNE